MHVVCLKYRSLICFSRLLCATIIIVANLLIIVVRVAQCLCLFFSRNRRKAFEKYAQASKWSSLRKERMKLILRKGIDYMSFEDSNCDSDSDDTVRGLIRWPLPWLKSKYSNSLHHLEKLHYENLSNKFKSKKGQERKVNHQKDVLHHIYAFVGDENTNHVPSSQH